MKIDLRSCALGILLGVICFWSIGQRAADPRGFSPWTNGDMPTFVTQSADGKTLYFWGDSLAPKVQAPTKVLVIQGEMSQPER